MSRSESKWRRPLEKGVKMSSCRLKSEVKCESEGKFYNFLTGWENKYINSCVGFERFGRS
jgi:hypothetical protein